MKADIVVLFTLFLLVLAGPPVECGDTLLEEQQQQQQPEQPEPAEPAEPTADEPTKQRSAERSESERSESERLQLEDPEQLGLRSTEPGSRFPNLRLRFPNLELERELAYLEERLRYHRLQHRLQLAGVPGVHEPDRLQSTLSTLWEERSALLEEREELEELEANNILYRAQTQTQMARSGPQTKGSRQKSIILGLSSLTIFSGLALLIFWILEKQRESSQTDIKG